jgi:hypothetical protein
VQMLIHSKPPLYNPSSQPWLHREIGENCKREGVKYNCRPDMVKNTVSMVDLADSRRLTSKHEKKTKESFSVGMAGLTRIMSKREKKFKDPDFS